MQRFRVNPTDFTRDRKLNFHSVLILLVQKSVKSLQLKLNEFVNRFELSASITASAFSQARAKLLPEAFQELNNVVLELIYGDKDHNTFFGFELLGVDGSVIRLPNSQSIKDKFGTTTIKAGSIQEEYCAGQFCCVYDCLNHVAIRSKLGSTAVYEATALQELLTAQPITELNNPLYIMDRGFASYDYMAWLIKRGMFFVIRLPKQSFKIAQQAFADDTWEDKLVEVLRTRTSKSNNYEGILETLNIRLIRIVLKNGNVEVLATNVTPDKISTDKFQELYHLRWQVETYFLTIKDRLSLENFTGNLFQSVLQDFLSTIFLSNLESFLAQPVIEELQAKPTRNPQKVNRCVAFHAIKDRAFDLLTSTLPTEEVLDKLVELFKLNPTQYRKGRDRPRRKRRETRSLNYHKYRKKHVF